MLESLKHEDLQFQELTPEEKEKRGILARLTGPIASFTKGTRNGRKYSDKLWEKAFDSPLVKEMFKNGGLPGELQHPADRSETDPTKIAIMMPEPPKKDSKGHLVASVDILDTPCGQIAYQLGKYGFKFGISSRGEGDLIQDFSGEESVDPDTYTLNAFDLVLIPACEDARLQFNESLNTKKSNKLRTILGEALNNASEVDRKIMEEALDELNIDDNWRYIETYQDEDIYYDPSTKKYIVGELDSYTVLNSLKNAKEYIDRYGVFDESYISSTRGDDNNIIHLEYTYDYYNDMTDREDRNLRGHINVRAESEEQAIQKARDNLDKFPGYQNNIRHFRVTQDKYTNVDLLEEQEGREETKPNEMASDILQNKPQKKPEDKQEASVNITNDIDSQDKTSEDENESETVVINNTEEDKEELDEALSPQEKMDAWHIGNRRENIKACGDGKLLRYLDICKNSGYTDEANIIKNELRGRGFSIPMTEEVEDMHRENDEPQRAPWDTDFHRLDKAYNHNFKQFNDMEAQSGMIQDFIDDLEAYGKEYDIYEHKTDPGCTIFFQESLNESCDGWIAFYNGKKLEITKNEADSLYDAKQKAIKELKVPKSKMGLLAIKPAYNESLNEDISWDELNGTEQSAVEAALANIKNGSKLEDAVHGAVAMYNEANSEEEYEDEEFFGEEANYTKVLDYVKQNQELTEANGNDPHRYVKLEKPYRALIFDSGEVSISSTRPYDDGDYYYANYDGNGDNIFLICQDGKVKEKIEADPSDESFSVVVDKLKELDSTVKNHIIHDSLDIDDVELAADNDGAIVEQLQNIIKRNKSLENKIKTLQEKLSVGYAKEMELKEELDTYKQKVSTLSKKTKEIKVLTEKLSKAEKILNDNKAQAEGKISTLNESIQSKESDNKDLRKDISLLNEAVDKKNSKIRSLNEKINEYKDQLSSKDNDIEQLKEKYETGQKDLEQLRKQYSKKVEQQNQIIEKYQRVAKNSVKRYIESQAVRLGVKSDEIVNRLPKNYSFKDIDIICEDLQEYKFNMSNLPFSQYGLNEGLKVTAKNVDRGLIEANPEDEITDYDLKIAEAFL